MLVKKITWRIIFILFYLLRMYQVVHSTFLSLCKPKHDYKIFCIGYSKTGTTSLYAALKILGYRTLRIPFGWIYANKGPRQYLQALQRCNFDAFIDYPLWGKGVYQIIDNAFPDSKFILTVRDNESFAKSFVNHFKGSGSDLTVTTDDELQQLLREYETHNAEVQAHFTKKPSRLLIMNVIDGDGWEKLCPFLDKPIPSKPFPHKNKGKYRD